MINAKNKFDYYEQLKTILEKQGLLFDPYKEINYGIQFTVDLNGDKSVIRIYESKKGIRPDFSQVKKENIKAIIDTTLQLSPTSSKSKKKSNEDNNTDPLPIIGTDESGKGDYFGPLVTAAVYVNEYTADILLKAGIKDCKMVNDKQVYELAQKIKKTSPYSIVSIGNEKYNQLYDKFKNLNRLLAWSHARVIENILNDVECKHALSDKFADDKLIKNNLKNLEKGKHINISQRHRAEDNIAVAAASILARHRFLEQLKLYEEQYELEFPKGGASKKVYDTGESFILKYGKDKLNLVAKLHFKTTQDIVNR